MKNKYTNILFITLLIILILTMIFSVGMVLNKFGVLLISNDINNRIKGYENEIPNLNKNINNVYLGISIDNFNIFRFTAFSVEYKNNYYLITSGHSITDKNKVIENIKFISNNCDTYIYPELLYFENDLYGYRDFAIFSDNKLSSGIVTDIGKDKLLYVFGNKYLNINIIRSYYSQTAQGESGSPIIDKDGEVVGIITTTNNEFYTPINLVIKEIDKVMQGQSYQK